MLNNIHKSGLSKQHCKIKKNSSRDNREYLGKIENLLESKSHVLIVQAGANDFPKNINFLQ